MQAPGLKPSLSPAPCLWGQLSPPPCSPETALRVCTASNANPWSTSAGTGRSRGCGIGLDFPGSGPAPCLAGDRDRRAGEEAEPGCILKGGDSRDRWKLGCPLGHPWGGWGIAAGSPRAGRAWAALLPDGRPWRPLSAPPGAQHHSTSGQGCWVSAP